jgi:putative NADPH-quinone reductase
VTERCLVVNGHPDPGARRYCAALCEAYIAGARSRGWSAERLDVGRITTAQAVERIRGADHLAIVFPLWLGAAPPALQELFAAVAKEAEWPTAHLITTMDMPAILYRPRHDRHSRPLEHRNTFSMAGLHVGETILIGSVNTISQDERRRRLAEVQMSAAIGVSRAAHRERRSILGWRLPAGLSRRVAAA